MTPEERADRNGCFAIALISMIPSIAAFFAAFYFLDWRLAVSLALAAYCGLFLLLCSVEKK